jgi:hypothetical protein
MDTIKKTLQFVQVDDTELGQLVENRCRLVLDLAIRRRES